MRKLGDTPNHLTFAILLSAIFNTHELSVLTPQLHCLVLCSGLNTNAVLGSTLMRAYIHLGSCQNFRKVFDEIIQKDVTPKNVLILGYMEFGLTREARQVFDAMFDKTVFSWSTLINGYLKNNKLQEARSAFDDMTEKDVVSWTAMIKGYVQFGEFLDALELFVWMMRSGTRPNHYSFSTALDACAGCSSLLVGSQVHTCTLKFGTPLDVILSTSLVDMYGKCGDVEAAFRVFESMRNKNAASWNAIIGGYARNGLARRAVEEFQRMTKSHGVQPDEITFINVLSGCVHGGMVEEGEKVFRSMKAEHGVEAEMEHYACMVDLYGRAGELEKAEKLIKAMPYEPDVVVWGALLDACGVHSSVELGEIAANGISKLQQDHPAAYQVMSKIQGEKGVWSSVVQLKELMKERQAKKQKAVSYWI